MKEQEVLELVEYLNGEGPPLVITGSRGCGKTHLLGLLEERLRKETALCVAVSPEDSTREVMDYGLAAAAEQRMGRVLRAQEIGHRFLRSESLVGGPALPTVTLDTGRLYLLVDGLDYLLSRHDFDASFVPLDIPPSMRLVVAVASGPLAQALAARGWHVHQVQPLETEERRCLIQVKLGRRQEMDEGPPLERGQEMEEGLLAWRHGGHPQHLLMATAVARDTGQLPACEDGVVTVVERLLEMRSLRAEDVAFLAWSEHGLPFQELGERSGRWAMLCMEPLVVMRGGLFVPATDEVAEVMRARCSPEQQRAAHRRIAEIYEELAFYCEAAAHLMAIGEHARLATLLTRFEVFQTLVVHNRALLTRCWRGLPFRDGAERHQRMLDESLPRIEGETRVALLNNVGVIAKSMGWRDLAKRYQRQALEEAKRTFPATHNKVGIALGNLAGLLSSDASAAAEVEGLYQEMLTTLDGAAPVDKTYPRRWGVLRRYAEFIENGNPPREEEGLALRERGIAAARAEMGTHHPVVGYELKEASQAIRWLWPQRALAFAEEAHSIFLAAMGPWDESTLEASRFVAAAQYALGLSEQAEEACRQILEIGQAQVVHLPNETIHALNQLIEIAEGRDDQAEALRLCEAKYTAYCERSRFGPGHRDTLAACRGLAHRYEAAGCFDKALELDERLVEGFSALEGPEDNSVVGVHIAIARVLWRMGRRQDAEVRLERWARAIDDNGTPWMRGLTRWLQAEWAREDGRYGQARDLMKQALPLDQMEDVSPGWGPLYVLAAGHMLMDGEPELSARHHEAGAGLITNRTRYLGELLLRPYGKGADPVGTAALRDEVSARISLSPESPCRDRRRLPAQAIRAAWNPADGRTLAVLDKSGQTHLFAWHEQSAQLERLDQPFAKRELPKDLTAITLRWSSSGSALRLVTPGAVEMLGIPAKNDLWFPASPLSPDGRTLAHLGTRSVSLLKAHPARR